MNDKKKDNLIQYFQLEYFFEIKNKGFQTYNNVFEKSCNELNYQNILLYKFFYSLSVYKYQSLNILSAEN